MTAAAQPGAHSAANPAANAAKRRRELVLLVLLAVVAALVIRHAFGAAQTARAVAPVSSADDLLARSLLAAPNPDLHMASLRAVAGLRYQGSLRNLFQAAPTAPKPVFPAASGRARGGPAAGRRPGAAPAAPQGPPPPPPIPLKFYGYTTPDSAPGAGAGAAEKRVFLQLNDDIFIVAAGQVVAHRYQIVAVDKASVTVKDLDDQHTQVLPLLMTPPA